MSLYKSSYKICYIKCTLYKIRHYMNVCLYKIAAINYCLYISHFMKDAYQ